MPQISTKFTFFGSSQFSIYVLDELAKLGFTPNTIVTTPDKPQGRKLVMTPNVVKTWAIQQNIKVFDPARLGASFIEQLKSEPSISNDPKHVFIVASYGKILPEDLIELPPRKTLNIHPSLLPQYRGASPLQAAILNDTKNTGITIMRIDEEMDHGPIVAQKQICVENYFLEWPIYEDFEKFMAQEGAKLLARILPDWVAGKMIEKSQNHLVATYTKKYTKGDGEIKFTPEEIKELPNMSVDRAFMIFRKIQAMHEWPGSYFIIDHDGKKIRVKISQAGFDGTLVIHKVIPEGKSEMTYADFVSGYMK
jgi:methionyl-tRNA formyltransferase